MLIFHGILVWEYADCSDKDSWIKIEVEQGYSEFFFFKFNLAMLPFPTLPN